MLESVVSETVFFYCKPTISALRLIGGAPFEYEKKKDSFVFKKSRKFIVYSYSFAVILVVFSIFGLWCDATSCGKDYRRVKVDFDFYINTFDLTLVALNIFFGILIGPLKVEHLFGLLQCLSKIDSILKEPFTTTERDRKFSTIVFLIFYTFSVLGIIFETECKFEQVDDELQRNYGTIILFYTVTLTQQLTYWNIIRFIRRRIRSMNKKIELEIAKIQRFQCGTFGKEGRIKEWFLNEFHGRIDGKIQGNCFFLEQQDSTLKNLRQLMTVHEQIYLCVNYINKFFDFPILLILINCIIEMIINPWILLTKSTTMGRDEWMIIIWVFLRALQIIFLVEPIHGVLVEHKKTTLIIMQLMKHTKDGPMKREVELLSMQNQMYQIEFTSVDMISLHRTVYAAVTSAVTTYLVILIQFNK